MDDTATSAMRSLAAFRTSDAQKQGSHEKRNTSIESAIA